MKRSELEHIIRAAAAISNEYELVVIGSQSILGAIPSPPEPLALSMEADLYPLANPGLADLIDGSIGEGSAFHEQFGYYAQGVAPETAILPTGWKDRLVKIQNQGTDFKSGYCLDPLDLAVAKIAAGREKDLEFVHEMIVHDIVGPAVLNRVAMLPIPPEHMEMCLARTRRLITEATGLLAETDESPFSYPQEGPGM